MRFKTIVFAFIGSLIAFSSCEKDEDEGTIFGGGGDVHFQISLNPPRDSTNIYFSVVDTGGNTLIWAYQISDTTFLASGFSTDTIQALQNDTLGVILSIVKRFETGTVAEAECSNFRVKTFVDGQLFDDRTFNVGFHYNAATPNPCPDGNQSFYNLIIP